MDSVICRKLLISAHHQFINRPYFGDSAFNHQVSSPAHKLRPPSEGWGPAFLFETVKESWILAFARMTAVGGSEGK